MKRSLVMEKYPVCTMTFTKGEGEAADMDAIVAHFLGKIEADPKAAMIGVFDHYAHTQSIGGEIAPEIKAAKNIVFCFGPMLPSPAILAVRPRSIGVAETDGGFVVTFLEAPAPQINEKMENWVKELAK